MILMGLASKTIVIIRVRVVALGQTQAVQPSPPSPGQPLTHGRRLRSEQRRQDNMSGYPRFMAVTGKSLQVGAMLGAAMLLVLIVGGAGQSVQGQTFSVLHNFNLDSGDGGF